MLDSLQYLLLQVRNPEDPMREHEVRCFARALGTEPARIDVFDLLAGCPTPQDLGAVDVVLLGGSGDYSVARGGPWLEPALTAMRELAALAVPTFASCWGFQAMARALGGTVVTDVGRAEVGTHHVRLTEAGRLDPVFGPLGSPFLAQMGHEDIVETLPPGAILLASTDRVTNQAFRLEDVPIYCTQFHPELDEATLLDRLRTYPRYVEKIAGVSFDALVAHLAPSPATGTLLQRFLQHVIRA